MRTRNKKSRLSIGEYDEVVQEGFQLLTQSIGGISQWPVVKDDLARRHHKKLYADLQSTPGLSMQDDLIVA